jgi:putative DNA primase/helicase
VHVAAALHKHFKRARLLVCADDDYLTEGNPGVTAAQNAALAVNGETVAPLFTYDRAGKKITDFNDLHMLEGLHVVRGQIDTRLLDLKWQAPELRAGALPAEGGGESVAMLARRRAFGAPTASAARRCSMKPSVGWCTRMTC